MNFYSLELPPGGRIQARGFASLQNPMDRKYYAYATGQMSPGPTHHSPQLLMRNHDYLIGGTNHMNHYAPAGLPMENEKPLENAAYDDVPIVPIMNDLSSAIMSQPSWEAMMKNIWEENLVNSIWDELLPDASVENDSYEDKLPAASSDSSAGPLQSYPYFAPPTAKSDRSPDASSEVQLINSAPPLQRTEKENRPKLAKRPSKAKKGPSQPKIINIKLYEQDEENIQDKDEKKKVKKAKRSKQFREKIKRLANHQCICCLLPKFNGGELQELFKSLLEGKNNYKDKGFGGVESGKNDMNRVKK